mmetsp:Transcript_40443/g.112343  ORF Transcript_40443/g.112343 Transcript_40443/m.112343 type:complete len:103 (+) Transcript_40443:158-466(+)
MNERLSLDAPSALQVPNQQPATAAHFVPPGLQGTRRGSRGSRNHTDTAGAIGWSNHKVAMDVHCRQPFCSTQSRTLLYSSSVEVSKYQNRTCPAVVSKTGIP